MIKPSQNPVTLGFGATDPPYSATNRHKGVDFGHSPDPNIYMPDNGTVTLVPNNGNDGNGVYFSAGGFQHGLLHTSKYLVGNGAFVKQGAPVAVMGDTGLAQGVHLHWAVKKNGVFVNGLDYVTEGEDMFNLTKEQIMAISRMATGRYPGKDFDYNKFTGQSASQAVVDELIQTFAPYSEERIAEYVSLQQQVSALGGDIKTLSPGKYLVTKGE